MIQERQNQVKSKKVDYKILSDCVCKECNKPLKQNSKNKNFKLCFYCFKLSKGKKFSYKTKRGVDGEIISKIEIDHLKIQKQNILKYRNLNVEKSKRKSKSLN